MAEIHMGFYTRITFNHTPIRRRCSKPASTAPAFPTNRSKAWGTHGRGWPISSLGTTTNIATAASVSSPPANATLGMTSPYWSGEKRYTRLQGKNTLNDGQATFAIGIDPKRSPLTRTNPVIRKSRNPHKIKTENATSYLTTTETENATSYLTTTASGDLPPRCAQCSAYPMKS